MFSEHIGIFLFTLTLFLAAIASFRGFGFGAASISPVIHDSKQEPKILLHDHVISDLRASRATQSAPDVNLVMRVVVSLAVLACALFIILSRKFEAEQQKWAFGSVGTILGYWLKG